MIDESIMYKLVAIETVAPLEVRERALEATIEAYQHARMRGERRPRAIAVARDRALRTLQIVGGARDIAALAIELVDASPLPTVESVTLAVADAGLSLAAG